MPVVSVRPDFGAQTAGGVAVTARRDLAVPTQAAEHDVDRLYDRLAPLLRASLERHAEDGRVTAETRRRVLADWDILSGMIFPRERGAYSAVEAVVLLRARQAARRAIAAAVEDMRARLAKREEWELMRRMNL
jgi:hypothetical protein